MSRSRVWVAPTDILPGDAVLRQSKSGLYFVERESDPLPEEPWTLIDAEWLTGARFPVRYILEPDGWHRVDPHPVDLTRTRLRSWSLVHLGRTEEED